MNNVEFASYADDNTPFFEGDDCKMLQNYSSNGLMTTKRKVTRISVILFVALL